MKSRYGLVADELARRGNHRVGLDGVLIHHLPTGLEFVCLGSIWSQHKELMLFASPHTLVHADECMLLSPWPIPNSARLAMRGRSGKKHRKPSKG